MASSRASFAGEGFPLPAVMPSEEKYKTPDLESLRVLLCPNEGEVSPETKEMLERASREIVHHIKLPLESGINTITNYPRELTPEVLQQYEKEIKSGIEALDFLAGFCETLRGPGGCENVLVDIRPVKEKGVEVKGAIEISVVGKETGDVLGVVGGRKVGKVSVIIKRGNDEAKDVYTSQQINFRLSDSTFESRPRKSEIRSLRVGLHTENRNLVQVDAVIGNSEDKAAQRTSKKHQEVKALSGPGASEKFGMLQDVFLLNFVGNVIGDGQGDGEGIDYKGGRVLVRGGIAFAQSDERMMEKDFVRTCKRTRNRLSDVAIKSNGKNGQGLADLNPGALAVPEGAQGSSTAIVKVSGNGKSVESATQTESERVMSDLKEAFKVVDDRVIWYLREALLKQALDDAPKTEIIKTLTDTELLALYLLGLPFDDNSSRNLIDQKERIKTLIEMLSLFDQVPATTDTDFNVAVAVLQVIESDPVFVLAKGLLKADTSDEKSERPLERLSFIRSIM